MELRCMQSPTLSSIPRSVLLQKPFLSCGHSILKLSGNKRASSDVRKLKLLDFRVCASGIASIKSQAQDATPSDGCKKDGNLVFVAGATGRVGSRTVRELLKLGFSVRAGVRSTQRAESLVQSVKNMKLDDATGGTQPIDKLEVVECDLEKSEQIRPALGSSSAVICCIGASEKEIFDITGPYRIDYLATKNLIDAATSAKVEFFILLTSLGTRKFGFPAAILNLFWGVLCWKRRAEEALLASNIPYAIVRPGGMERPTDSFKETHNITLSKEDTLFGSLVSNLQVAELLAFMAKNRSLSCCKVVEVIAETTAPLTPLGELLKMIPSNREDICSFKESDDADKSLPVVLDTSSKEEVPKPTSAIKATPLSPYTAYEDLKPPSSPTPTAPSGSKAEPSIAPTTTEVASQLTGGNDVAKSASSDATVDTSTTLASTHSPYTLYDDLKPPTSPTPSVPKLSVNNNPGETVDKKSEIRAESKTRPLSPYTMYVDMKPPSSPMPSQS